MRKALSWSVACIAFGTVALAGCSDVGSSTTDAPNPLDVGPDARGRNFGRVLIVEEPAPGQAATTVVAGFGTSVDQLISSRDDGSCHIERYIGATAALVDAGTITLSGGVGGSIVLMADMQNNYGATFQGPRFASNDTILLQTTGGSVAAFTSSVAFPPTLTLLGPTDPTTLSKSGFSASWEPTPGSVRIALSQYSNVAPDTSIECLYLGSDGVAAIPASALSDLTSGAAAGIGISTMVQTMTSAGSYEIRFAAFVQPFRASVTVVP